MSLQEFSGRKELGIKEIEKILPHRYPFLLVDKVLDIDVEQGTILAQKNLTMNEQFFQGHFPGAPIMPGVLILEALAQAGGVLVYLSGYEDKIAVLMNVHGAKFRNPVKPGDVLQLRAEKTLLGSKAGKFKTTAMIGDKVAVDAEMAFALVDKDQI